MSFILFLILSLCAVQIIGVILINMIYRQYLSTMHGMLISMSLGMLAGLLFGTILGLILNGDLFRSTIFSILIGLSIGFLAGLPFSLAAVIEGSISGIMGGMMGAMLGEMIPMSYSDGVIKLMAFYTIMILVLVSYFTETTVKTKKAKIPFSVSRHPFLYIFVIALLFILLKDVSLLPPKNQHLPHGF